MPRWMEKTPKEAYELGAYDALLFIERAGMISGVESADYYQQVIAIAAQQKEYVTVIAFWDAVEANIFTCQVNVKAGSHNEACRVALAAFEAGDRPEDHDDYSCPTVAGCVEVTTAQAR